MTVTIHLSSLWSNHLVWIGAWWLGGLLAIFVPLIKWGVKKRAYYSLYGQYIEYEQAQRAYEEAQNQNDDNNYNAYNCKWWQYNCRKQQYYYAQQQDNNSGDGNQFYTPGWYQFLGGKTEEDRRMQEEMGMNASSNSGALKFVYTWSLLLFVALLVYGTFVLYKKQSVTILAVCMAILTQYSLLMLIMLPQGVISTEDREMEDSVYGWYGQLSVLMVYFNFGQFLFGALFLLLGTLKMYLERRFGGGSQAQHTKDHDDYQPAEKLQMA